MDMSDKAKALVICNKMYEKDSSLFLEELHQKFSIDMYIVDKKIIGCEDMPYITCKGNVVIHNQERNYSVIVIIQPFFTEYSDSSYYRCLRYELFAQHLVMFDLPDKFVFQKVYDKLLFLYEKARFIDREVLQNRNHNITVLLQKGTRYRMKSNNGTDLYFERKSDEIYEENGTLDNIISQIPGGEVFFAIENCSGRIKLPNSKNDRYNEIRDSIVTLYGKQRVICEFGIGTNDAVRYLNHLPINEKALGTCHFGFGNNMAFGGKIDEPYHFDITFPNFELYIVENEKEIKVM